MLTGNLGKVALGNPRVPVLVQQLLRAAPVLQLAERVLVDNVVVTRRFKEAGRDPRLEDEPLRVLAITVPRKWT